MDKLFGSVDAFLEAIHRGSRTASAKGAQVLRSAGDYLEGVGFGLGRGAQVSHIDTKKVGDITARIQEVMTNLQDSSKVEALSPSARALKATYPNLIVILQIILAVLKMLSSSKETQPSLLDLQTKAENGSGEEDSPPSPEEQPEA